MDDKAGNDGKDEEEAGKDWMADEEVAKRRAWNHARRGVTRVKVDDYGDCEEVKTEA